MPPRKQKTFVLALAALHATVMTVKNQGFILIGFIVVIFIIVTSATLYFSQRFGESKVLYRRTAYKASEANLVMSIEASLKSQQGWMNTVNSSLNQIGSANLASCVSDPTYDCPPGNHPFSVIDDLNQVLIDSSKLNTGLDLNFLPCTTYGSLTSTGCYMRYYMTWTPECPATGPCTTPAIVVKGELLTAPSAAGEIDLKAQTPFEFKLR